MALDCIAVWGEVDPPDVEACHFGSGFEERLMIQWPMKSPGEGEMEKENNDLTRPRSVKAKIDRARQCCIDGRGPYLRKDMRQGQSATPAQGVLSECPALAARYALVKIGWDRVTL